MQNQREKLLLEEDEEREPCVLELEFPYGCASLRSKEAKFLRNCAGLLRILHWVWLSMRDVTIHTQMKQWCNETKS